MWSCDQSLVTLTLLWEKLWWPQFYKDLTWTITFFERWSWFKFNNLGLALCMILIFYFSVAKGLKLKVRKFWGLISTFVEVRGEKLVWGDNFPPSRIGLSFPKMFFVQLNNYLASWTHKATHILYNTKYRYSCFSTECQLAFNIGCGHVLYK